MRVRISRAAQRELQSIIDYIGRDNSERAVSFGRELLERCFGLSMHARRYPVILTRRGQDVRRAGYRTYVILYSITGDEVRIQHIVHGARDYIRLLFPDG